MNIKDFNNLPQEVQDFIWDVISDQNYELSDKYDFSFGQFEFINQIEDDIILKKKEVIDLPKYLKKMPGNFGGDFRELALIMATKIFWPLQGYLSNVDRLILRLGGKVPQPVALKKRSPVSEGNVLNDKFSGTVNELMKLSDEFKSLRLTANKISTKDGKSVSPSVENWINDYVHFLGAGQHSSLDRAKYLSKSSNAANLSDEYKESLRFLLLSYDEDAEVVFDKTDGLLRVGNRPARSSDSDEEEDVKSNIDELLDAFGNKLQKIQENLIGDDIILSEAGGDTNKIRDILWDALGIGDNDKVISCVRLLMIKRAFDNMILTDNRFKNILKRFIGIKYGQSMQRALDDNMDKLIIRRLFLEMLLADKLKLSEDNVYVTAFYLTNLVPNSGQVVYLDKKDRLFKWLEIQITANKFVWVNNI